MRALAVAPARPVAIEQIVGDVHLRLALVDPLGDLRVLLGVDAALDKARFKAASLVAVTILAAFTTAA